MDWIVIGASAAGFLLLPLLLLFLIKIYIGLTIGRCRSENRLEGKTVIVTGANSGIGKETARRLAGHGARVILACRSLDRANAAVIQIRQEHPNCEVTVKQLDLCKFESIRAFATDILQTESRLDVLINNAGISGGDFHLTKDGYEEIYQANYLGPVLLTDLLLPLLKKSAPSRVINTGSCASMFGSVNVETFAKDVKSSFDFNFFRYGVTKQALAMWTQALAEELESAKISVNVVHPGVVKTPIASKEDSWTLSNIIFNINIFVTGRSAEDGAQTLIHLSLTDDGQQYSGKYWAECRPAYVPRFPRNMEKNRRLLSVTRNILSLSKE